jgi:hypothetical protein
VYIKHHKLTSGRCNHSDFKVDIEKELLKRAQEVAADVEEDAGITTRASVTSVSSGKPRAWRGEMPPKCRGHALSQDPNRNRECVICGSRTKTSCGCGQAVCGAVAGVNCWALHLDAVATGSTLEPPSKGSLAGTPSKSAPLMLYNVFCKCSTL